MSKFFGGEMSDVSDLRPVHLEILRRALGLDIGAEPYRNYFLAHPEGTDFCACEDLVSLGLMRGSGDHKGLFRGWHLFAVTASGMDVVADDA